MTALVLTGSAIALAGYLGASSTKLAMMAAGYSTPA